MQNRREQVATVFLQRLNDPGYRFKGENPANATLEQAQHWVSTYDRIVTFKRELLDLCQRYAEHSEPEVARVIRETDMIMLEVQLSRFEQKRDYWKIHATELAGNGRRGARN